MMYYILALDHHNSEALTWWGPDNSGYTIELDRAGKYSQEAVEDKKYYYDNKTGTVAIPCHMVEEFTIRIVPSFMTMEKFQKYTKISEVCP